MSHEALAIAQLKLNCLVYGNPIKLNKYGVVACN